MGGIETERDLSLDSTFFVAFDLTHRALKSGLAQASSLSVTQYRVLERAEKTALLELHPLTGRTHQLRLHCMASGFPILGDPQYTSPESTAYSAAHGLFTQQLCAARLVFPHPMTGERMEILSRQAVFFPKD